MTEKKSDTRWQLTMKNGGNVTFDVTANDDTDTDIEEWMGELENGYDGVIKVTLGLVIWPIKLNARLNKVSADLAQNP